MLTEEIKRAARNAWNGYEKEEFSRLVSPEFVLEVLSELEELREKDHALRDELGEYLEGADGLLEKLKKSELIERLEGIRTVYRERFQ